MSVSGPVEIEVKFFLPEVDSTRDRILAEGATSHGKIFEANLRFEDNIKNLKNRGILLRLRADEKTWLTVKSPPPTPDKDFKVHREFEVEVDDLETCRAILESLGFHVEQTYEKWRETFLLGQTKLLVDTMPFGVFLEIEGKESDIRHAANSLGLKWAERILLNYLEIFEIIQRNENLSFNDITFDNFTQASVDMKKYLPLLYAG